MTSIELAIRVLNKEQPCNIQLFVQVDVHSKQALNVTVWFLGLQGILKHHWFKKSSLKFLILRLCQCQLRELKLCPER